MKIIVIGYTSYKEKDLIVNAISEGATLSFKARGALAPNSAFAWLANPLVVAEVDWVENVRYRHQILKEAKLISYPIAKDTTLEKMQNIGFVLDVVNSMFQEEEKYLLFDEILTYLEDTKDIDRYYFAQLVFLAKAMKKTGSAPEVNHCVYCGSRQDIVAFSFQEGGFICRNCLEEDIAIDLNPTQMKLIIYIFNVQGYKNLAYDKVSKEDIKTLFIKFNEFIKDGIGVYINSLDNIIKSL